LIGGSVDLIFSTAIYDDVNICVRDLCQLIRLSEETFGSLSGFLSDNVSLGSNFRHEEIGKCFDRSFLEPQWQYIPLGNNVFLKAVNGSRLLSWMPFGGRTVPQS
jgi:hypothetical protein